MQRRAFLQSLTALVGGFALPAAALAGFQFHHGETLWPQLAAGQRLTLKREADNRFDERAVRVEWQGHKLGYLPRIDNAAVSQLLDKGETLEAAIAGLENSSNPWDMVKVEVRWRV